jgi:hypothetical protein
VRTAAAAFSSGGPGSKSANGRENITSASTGFSRTNARNVAMTPTRSARASAVSRRRSPTSGSSADGDAASMIRPLAAPPPRPLSARMLDRQATLLRLAFLVGAVTDALAVVPMLCPPVARLLWGFEATSGPYRFAMGYGAALMLGWTALLVWAWQRPLERQFVAALTVLVIYGLVAAEIVAVAAGDVAAARMAPTWCLQAALLALFAGGYHWPALRRWGGAPA